MEKPIAEFRSPSDGCWKLWRLELSIVTDQLGYATPLDCGLPIAGERPIVVVLYRW